MNTHGEVHGYRPMDPRQAQEVLLDEAERAMRTATHIMEAEWKRRGQRSRRTGHGLRSIQSEVRRYGSTVVGAVGTNVWYWRLIDMIGTGLYGPRNRWIEPRTARALRFPRGGGHTSNPATGAYTGFRNAPGFRLSGQQRQGRAGQAAGWVFARRVRGVRPRRYARDASLVARPRVQRELRNGARRAAMRLARGVAR